MTRPERRPTPIDRAVLGSLPRALAADVYGFKLFTKEAAAQALRYFVAHSTPTSPNSMNKYGRGLDREASSFVAELVEEYVAPLARERYGMRLRKHPYAFIVDYSCETQKGLRWHVDSSDVTLNVCLGTVFKGGDLMLAGEKDGSRMLDRTQIEQKIGTAIVHRGSLEHAAAPLTGGFRTNLILWCSKYGSKPAGVPRR